MRTNGSPRQPLAVVRGGQPNVTLAREILRRIERRGPDPKLKGRAPEALDRMVKATRRALGAEKVARRP